MLRNTLLTLTIFALLFLGLTLWATEFNRYSWANPPILDCDTDAEAAFTLFAWLTWLITAVLLIWHVLPPRKLGVNLPTAAVVLALMVSGGGAVKYAALQDYSKQLAVQCGEQ